MVRIRVKILQHDGQSKKPSVVQCIAKADALVFRVIEPRDAFFLITDNENMDRLLQEKSKKLFFEKGLEIQTPPEYVAARTIMLKNVDGVIAEMSVDEICEGIDKNFKVKKVVKIPNNTHLLKIIFESAQIADKVVKEGLVIHFQKFEGKNVEKEIFIPIIPCFRCYRYDHLKRSCLKPDDFKICSNCSREGHVYTECHSLTVKCLNCNEHHRTLAAKCPIRKAIVKEKIKERKEGRDRMKTRVQENVPVGIGPTQIPEKYLAIMAATIIIADRREEVPGVFQYIVDEMLRADDVPNVKFPDFVIRGYKDSKQKETARKQERKRMRSSTDGDFLEEGLIEYECTMDESLAPCGKIGKAYDKFYVMDDGSMQFVSDSESSAAPTPAPTPVPTPSTTPHVTPATSPVREQKRPKDKGAVAKKPKGPNIVLIVRSDLTLPESITHPMLKKEIGKGKIIKYVYTNSEFKSQNVKEKIRADHYKLDRVRRVYMMKRNFDQVKSGVFYEEETIAKAEYK